MGTDRDMQRYYARRAPEYERIYDLPERQEELAELKHMLPGFLRERAVLEIACGTGYWTHVAATAARSILATDVSEEVLTIARSKDYGDCEVRFEIADAYQLPDSEAGLDGSLVAFWWSHMPRERTTEFVRGLCTRLNPGARIVILDNAYAEGSSTPVSRVDEHGNQYQRRTLTDGSTWEVLKNFPKREEVEAAMGAQATIVDYREMEFYWWAVAEVVASPAAAGG